ncbi:hypothetical protein BGZ58_001285 [Dissophora ornata]|nr:hypothetical protein BGZ58_001285 [Dissophora ornata]
MGVLNREEGLKSYGYKDDDFPTESSELQESPMPEPNASIELKKNRHVKYLLGALDSLPSYWTALDASKPWLCYWIIHSLDLLDHRIPESLAQRAISTLRHVQCETGGFAGGPGQDAHVATTYAAVNTLAIIGTKEAYDVINRATLLEFLLRIKQKDGSFKMMVGGEIDVRGSYCAMSAATITNIRTPELEEGVAEFVGRCQTYEGGLGGYPGVEAHGGYAFCGLAALELLGRTDVLNMNTLVKWSVNRQMSLEGGFQGRTNKLVDGCYSFWMGGVFPIIGKMLESLEQDKEALNFVYDRDALQEYLLIACQSSSGGLRDKPFKHELVDKAPGALSSLLWTENLDKPRVVGSPTNMVEATHPLLNIRLDKVRKAFVHFYGKAAEDVIEEVDIEVVDIEIIHA